MPGVTYIKFDYQSLAERWMFYLSGVEALHLQFMAYIVLFYGQWVMVMAKSVWKIFLFYH